MTGPNNPPDDKTQPGAPDTGESDPEAETPQDAFPTSKSGLIQFKGPEWEIWPFNMMHQSFQLSQKSWHDALDSFDGVPPREKYIASIAAQQIFDMASPANGVWSNPEVIARTMSEGGTNLLRGALHLAQDWQRAAWGLPPVGADDYRPGRDVAVAPGKVVYRSDLLELIQYSPQTETVAAEPVLIVPAWLMKYYILDLSPQNSLVNYLCGQGFTVFMISWVNPGAQDGDICMADYLDAVTEALDGVGSIVPDARVHAIGYCLGGTLLTVKAAQMARDHDERLKTLTLFASQIDFEERAEFQMLLGETEILMLEHLMSKVGYLDGKHIAEAYKVLRAGEWIWPRHINDYLMGRRQPMSDIEAWSVDTTRLPGRAHSEYLRSMVLNNAVAEGRYDVDGRPISLGDITVPVFSVAARDDRIAPWRSLFKLRQLVKSSVTFALTTGGHVDGIIGDPDGRGQSYQIGRLSKTADAINATDWQERTPCQDGSWWPELVGWLRSHSDSARKPPPMGGFKGLAGATNDAPGTYVFQN
ncbi:poly-beta-hydroxybutyrate polymerase [Rhodobacteraceae bacterium KMM 6894]|nr:poly-beta-hydroxybutyrate polymerase [Rhodobacteraceae bacterium KMM 6894]